MIDHILSDKASLGKFKKTNHIKHLFQPQHYEARNQLQGKKDCKRHKHMEVKQYATNQPMDH